MSYARAGHAATLLANGKVLVVRGFDADGGVGGVELYDPSSDTWSSAARIHTNPEFGSTVTLLANGKVLVAGGFFVDHDGTGPGDASTQLYDPVNDTWSSAASMNTGRDEHTATLLPSGKVLVTGGFGDLSSAELYDPVSNTWSPAASMSARRKGYTATLLADGKVLIAGGFKNRTATASTESMTRSTVRGRRARA
jgi:N-acetylneuraminic acid mutarotase